MGDGGKKQQQAQVELTKDSSKYPFYVRKQKTKGLRVQMGCFLCPNCKSAWMIFDGKAYYCSSCGFILSFDEVAHNKEHYKQYFYPPSKCKERFQFFMM